MLVTELLNWKIIYQTKPIVIKIIMTYLLSNSSEAMKYIAPENIHHIFVIFSYIHLKWFHAKHNTVLFPKILEKCSAGQE